MHLLRVINKNETTHATCEVQSSVTHVGGSLKPNRTINHLIIIIITMSIIYYNNNNIDHLIIIIWAANECRSHGPILTTTMACTNGTTYSTDPEDGIFHKSSCKTIAYKQKAVYATRAMWNINHCHCVDREATKVRICS